VCTCAARDRERAIVTEVCVCVVVYLLYHYIERRKYIRNIQRTNDKKKIYFVYVPNNFYTRGITRYLYNKYISHPLFRFTIVTIYCIRTGTVF